MTRQTFEYRTNPLFLRNGFYGAGSYEMPIIPKFKTEPDDFADLPLIGFDKNKLDDENHLSRMVHFFLYDNKFVIMSLKMKFLAGLNLLSTIRDRNMLSTTISRIPSFTSIHSSNTLKKIHTNRPKNMTIVMIKNFSQQKICFKMPELMVKG